MRVTPILAEDYMRKMSKANRQKADHKLNKLIHYFGMLNQYEHLSDAGMEGEDISQKTMQHLQHANNVQAGRNKQSSNGKK